MNIYKIKKGLDIPIKGEASKTKSNDFNPAYVAVKPMDFIGFSPKVMVKSGDAVQVGSPVISNKLNENVFIPSPVSGTIEEIVRGEKRVLLEVRIKNDFRYESVKIEPQVATRDNIIETLQASGLWSLIRQRPFDIIPFSDKKPRDIFISAFDSSPLAPDYDFVLNDKGSYMQEALNVLSKLTTGKVYLSLKFGASNAIFESLVNVEKNYFKGPHPCGNVGVQIHHIKPINKGEILWYLNVQDLVKIGKLFKEGVVDLSKIVAVTGPEVLNPSYIKTIAGSNISGMLKLLDNNKDVRYISGNILTGDQIPPDGYLNYYHNQLSVIAEGKHYEFLGWLAPGFKKLSRSNLFLSRIFKPKNFDITTNYHGGERAYVVTGQYEKVFPFDIYPVYLMKAVITNDIDKMEQLGIYEVSPEDFALCDFVCTSKIENQDLVRNALEMLRNEMS
jgi:Na+-transporting NADH:ubiquinone oxidoreductase subunit A